MIRLTVMYNLPEGTDEDEFLKWRLGEHQEENASMPGVIRTDFARIYEGVPRGEAAPEGSRGENSQYVKDYMTDKNYTIVETLSAWAEERGHTMSELAHAWLLAQPTVCSVISGLTRLEHLQVNAKAGDWSLTADEVAAVNAVLAQ